MNIALSLYEKIRCDDEPHNKSVELDAARLAVAESTFTLDEVKYVVYIFSDGSELRFGSNGYVGTEHKELKP